MDGTDIVSLIWGGIMIVTLLASFTARRVPWRDTARMAAGWIGIAGVLFVAFSYRHQFSGIWQTITRDFSSEAQTDAGGTVRIPRDDSGHYYAKAQINGRDVELLVDTGATYTVFPEAMARDLGIEVDKSGFPTISNTANGPVTDWRAKAGSLRVGSIVRNDFPVRVTEGALDQALLGMNWLDTLQSWRVEGGELVLVP